MAIPKGTSATRQTSGQLCAASSRSESITVCAWTCMLNLAAVVRFRLRTQRGTTKVEADMRQRTFSLIAGVVLGLIALGHVLRIVLGWSFMVQDFSVPMWASGVAVVILGYLAYEGFRLARKSSSAA